MKNRTSRCWLAVGTLFAAQFTTPAEESAAGADARVAMKCVVAFGDSITRGYAVPEGSGWVELLSGLMKKEYGEKAPPVFNAGSNGDTSSEGVRRIKKDVLPRMPGLVLVEFGGNDTVHTARAVSVEAFERNLLATHEQVRGKGGEVVFVTFPPVVNEWHSTRKDSYYEKWGGVDQCAEQYRQRTRDVAKRVGAPLFDLDQFLRKRIGEKGREAIINKDGVHLTPEANTLVAEAMLAFLKESGKLPDKGE